MQTYEIEVKCLLGGKESADSLLNNLRKDASFKQTSQHKQLNHYFIKGDLHKLYNAIKDKMSSTDGVKLKDITNRAKNHSVRTRLADSTVILVVKASVDDTTSQNGTARLEFETTFPNTTLDQLDQYLLDCDFEYQAKWSRERKEFTYKEFSVSLDKNAGYGFLAEFELQITDPSKIDAAKEKIRAIIKELGIEELPQDRLERMFAYYNKNWKDYYGTEKTFTVH